MPRFTPHPDRRPALVTGASSGIGAATAVALAAAGHPVALGARRLDRCEAAAEAIRADGGEAVALVLDVTDEASVAAFVNGATDALGAIDVVVSNAGDVQPGGAIDTEPARFAAEIGVNLGGPQRLIHHAAPAMVQRGHGDIVFVTSEVARHPRPFTAAYVASKSGLESLAEVTAMELEGTGVRAGIVRPGPSSTEQGTTWSEHDINRIVAAWDQWGLTRHDGALRPADVARAVVAMVATPRGTHLNLIEVQPQAPNAAKEIPAT
ncbi:MAG TPA: SDR family oxidoreductase [Acidimicrobiales bacterium]|nr:SDR family oxidoreductase [Acidimicrobiales bacterium]